MSVLFSLVKYSNPTDLCAEHPQFVKEPDRHITAEMEKVVDIPCQARGEFVRLSVCMYVYA